jgi:hypothetical protein
MSEIKEIQNAGTRIVRLTPSSVITRWPCEVCGGCTEKYSVVATYLNGRGIAGDGECFVCEWCLEAGASDFPARLRRRAEDLEAHARFLRSEAQATWEVPTFEEWEQALARDEAKWEQAYADAEGRCHECGEPLSGGLCPECDASQTP